jgi:acyl carrier protein
MEKAIRSIIKIINPNVHPKNTDSFTNDLGFGSIQLLELIVNIEKLFKITIKDDDLIMENFDSIMSITHLLRTYPTEH